MSETTNIEWADSTFTPWIGCTKVSPGCEGCYAEALMDKRMGRVQWGAGQPRQRTSESYWRQPLAWDRKARENGTPWRVFCGSLCDVFDNEVPEEWRNDLWETVLSTPHLTWMLLTKRIGNARAMLPWADDAECPTPAHAWIGATVVNQEEADRDIPKLLSVPAAVRFLSIEPMLGPIDLTTIETAHGETWNCLSRVEAADAAAEGECSGTIDWVIVGGESDQPGHRARPFNIEWARDIVRQCKAAGVPAFVKQLGSLPYERRVDDDGGGCLSIHEPARLRLQDRAGSDPAEWPEDLRVRETPR